MDFDTLTAGLDGQRLCADRNPEILRIVRHSAQVQPGDLWVALIGAQVDAHRFLPQALERDAAALLLDERGQLPSRASLTRASRAALVVPNSRAALARVARRFYDHPLERITSVAVTGTNGKTTTSAMLESIFGASGRACGVIGTIFFRLGGWEIHGANTTPESLDLHALVSTYIDRGASAVVVEASSHGLEMNRLDGAHFDVGVFTNLSLDHLDFHGDMEAYFAAKRRLFTELLPAARRAGKLGVAVINRDDPYGRRLIKENAVLAVSYGLTDESDVHATSAVLSEAGTQCVLHLKSGERLAATLPLAGRHNIYNALAAAAAAEACGISSQAIRRGLAEMPPVRGRLERIDRPEDRGPAVFVDYAHTPEALGNVLSGLRELAPAALWVVFGCGGDRDRQKRPEMGRLAAELADVAIVTSDNPRSEPPDAIIEAIESGMRGHRQRLSGAPDAAARGYLVEPDREKAIHLAVGAADRQAIVLIAGKGHETVQKIGDRVHPFDDAEVARRALAERGRRSQPQRSGEGE